MRVAHLNHRRENLNPDFRRGHHRVWKHAAVQQICSKARVGAPVSSRNQSPAIWTISIFPFGSSGGQWRPVKSCEPSLLPSRRSEPHGSRLSRASMHWRPGAVRWPGCWDQTNQNPRQQSALGRVVAQSVEHRVCHVSLKTKGFGTVHQFQKLHHMFPAVHAPQQISPSAASLSP